MAHGKRIVDRSDSRYDEDAHMLDNIAADAARFTPDEVKELNAALAHTPVYGARLPAMVLSLSGVEAPVKEN
jgi:hypothetical protein